MGTIINAIQCSGFYQIIDGQIEKQTSFVIYKV